jgi:hypothetical protein
MPDIACPSCGQPHRGPRDLTLLHEELSRIHSRAAEMTIPDAAGFLRVHLLALGLELSAICPGCILTVQDVLAGAVSSGAVERAGDRHICIVYPMEVYRGRMLKRDLLDIGKTFDTERK